MRFFCFCSFRRSYCVVARRMNRFECAARTAASLSNFLSNVFFYLMSGWKHGKRENFSNSVIWSPKAQVDLQIREVLSLFSSTVFTAQPNKTSKLKVGALSRSLGPHPSPKGPTQTRLGPPRGSRWTWVKAAGRTTEIKRLQNGAETPPPVGPCVSRRAVICHLGSRSNGGHIPQCPARQGATVPVVAH